MRRSNGKAMKNSVIKMTLRSVKTFKGRFIAIFLIVAIGVGFFAGMKITQDAMIDTAHKYLQQQNLYDIQLISTLGFTDENVEELSTTDGIKDIEGLKSVDAMLSVKDNLKAFKIISIPKKVSVPSLVCGRMPETNFECLADDQYFDETDIGSTIVVSDENTDDVKNTLSQKEFVIVGLVNSPTYLNINRGNTTIGTGALASFIYVQDDCFALNIYTEVNITLNESAYIYSDEYDEIVERHKSVITEKAHRICDERYLEILSSIDLPEHLAVLGITVKQFAAQMGLEEPDLYVLTRNENVGYSSFENDTAIVSGIANIFPVFFILIAMFVCITTMTRMVDEERTQIGVLKAMGFHSRSIMAKYLRDAGSAAFLGWVTGFFLCTWLLPKLFWFAYNAIYDFAPIGYLFDPVLAVMTLVIAMLCILGAAYICCRKELSSVPAQLIRPRAAKSGKRILLERITPIWNRLPFLGKVITRNMFRYKRKLIMMLLGISCCAGLMVAAFGARDSMLAVTDEQYGKVQIYDMEVTFDESEKNVEEKLLRQDGIEEVQMASVHRVDLISEDIASAVTMMSFSETEDLSHFWSFEFQGEKASLPNRGEALICSKLAEKFGLSVGDSISLRDSELNTFNLTVGGIFDNHIYNYVVISEETHQDVLGQWKANTAMLNVSGDQDALAERLTKMDEINGVSQLSAARKDIDDALVCLDYIIWMVVAFSAALAFVVIFNLTNINLAERSREIATVEVLGFYPKETYSYVLRENLIMSVISAFLGIPLGFVFHRLVMKLILIDALHFPVFISPVSIITAFVCTILFAVIVNLFMRKNIRKINMAESLKAVE